MQKAWTVSIKIRTNIRKLYPYTGVYKVVEELIKKNTKRPGIASWSKLFFDFYGEDFLDT